MKDSATCTAFHRHRRITDICSLQYRAKRCVKAVQMIGKSSETCANAFMNNWVSRFGPDVLTSDRYRKTLKLVLQLGMMNLFVLYESKPKQSIDRTFYNRRIVRLSEACSKTQIFAPFFPASTFLFFLYFEFLCNFSLNQKQI